MGIAIYVCTDLEHGHSTISTGQLEMVGFWQDHRRLYGSPGEPLYAKGESDLFCERRHVVVVEDQVGHRRTTIPHSLAIETDLPPLFAIVIRRRPPACKAKQE